MPGHAVLLAGEHPDAALLEGIQFDVFTPPGKGRVEPSRLKQQPPK